MKFTELAVLYPNEHYRPESVVVAPRKGNSHAYWTTSVIVHSEEFEDGRRIVIRDHSEEFLWLYLMKPGHDWRHWAIANVIDDSFTDVASAIAYAALPEAWEF